MTPPEMLVFLLDVDNTLLDTDTVTHDLKRHLAQKLGDAACDRYFELFESLRHELGYADYLGTLQRFRLEHPHMRGLLTVSDFLIDYPFPQRLFPGTLTALTHLRGFGETVILSDGDVVFQPHKIRRAGLERAVGGNVLIYIHKELELADVARLYPATHYVTIDDKLRLLSRIKAAWADRVTTVFVRQGHYAHDPAETGPYPDADVTLESIGDVVELPLEAFLGVAGQRSSNGSATPR